MGRYSPAAWLKKKSVNEALLEAEYEHHLACPNTDFGSRLAALILDSIFLFLIISGSHKIVTTLFTVLSPATFPISIALVGSTQWALSALAWYIFNIWVPVQWGGSPAKIILGLRVINSKTGMPLTLKQTIGREFIGKWPLVLLSFGYGLLCPLIRRDRKALHDILTSSCVKKTRPG
jgi:uncharacterized RDD family membrane protein YckC